MSVKVHASPNAETDEEMDFIKESNPPAATHEMRNKRPKSKMSKTSSSSSSSGNSWFKF